MRQPEFIINGVSRTTSHQVTLRLRAADAKAAEEQAVQRGLTVMTVEPAPSAGGAEPPPVQRLEDLDDPSSTDVSGARGFSTPVLGVFIVLGLAMVLYTAGSLPEKTKAYLAARRGEAPAAIEIKTVQPAAGQRQAAERREAVVVPQLALTYGIFIGGVLFLAVPAISLGRRALGRGRSSAE